MSSIFPTPILDSLPRSVLSELSDKHAPVKRNAARIDFVGIVWADGRPCIFWPKGMSDAARNATPRDY